MIDRAYIDAAEAILPELSKVASQLDATARGNDAAIKADPQNRSAHALGLPSSVVDFFLTPYGPIRIRAMSGGVMLLPADGRNPLVVVLTVAADGTLADADGRPVAEAVALVLRRQDRASQVTRAAN